MSWTSEGKKQGECKINVLGETPQRNHVLHLFQWYPHHWTIKHSTGALSVPSLQPVWKLGMENDEGRRRIRMWLVGRSAG